MMKTPLRDGKFDVIVAAAPGLEEWPPHGVRVLTLTCAESGLTVGAFGGEDVRVRGVIPLPGTGGIVITEDIQGRIHRLQARAVVKLSPVTTLPDPFPGWRSSGLIPLATAVRLRRESLVRWDPGVAILGTGNLALRFGSELQEAGVPEVYCIETDPQWGAKRFSGWEVERRRFEVAGGRIIEAKPIRLSLKSALRWEFRIQDSLGVRVLEVSRVVAAGPFGACDGVREHPAGSLLFELAQTGGPTPAKHMEGWVLEEERARWLGTRIARALSSELPAEWREELERVHRRARGRLKRYGRHREEPFTPAYQGKWMASADQRAIRAFSGTPQVAQRTRAVASIECFEQIPCNLCELACPTEAIRIGSVPRDPVVPVLTEAACTACGLCLKACPSSATLMMEQKDELPTARLTLPWRGAQKWIRGEFATLLNRRGEPLGGGRIINDAAVADPDGDREATDIVDDIVSGGPVESVQLVQVEVPAHLAWEARGLRRNRRENAEDEVYLEMVRRSAEGAGSKVEITFNGEKRHVRDQIPVTIALFETAWNRPEDALFCRDGSCGLCSLTIDGVKKLACQATTHRGMSIRTESSVAETGTTLCPCLGVTRSEVAERLEQGQLHSAEAVLSITHVGEGRCHGRLCMDPFLRQLKASGVETDSWVDWRFPWSDWARSRT